MDSKVSTVGREFRGQDGNILSSTSILLVALLYFSVLKFLFYCYCVCSLYCASVLVFTDRGKGVETRGQFPPSWDPGN